jgi:predicted nucleic acid-binding protein
MTTVVLDASVVVKWLLPERDSEEDVDRAERLLRQIQSSAVQVVQPCHWLAEAVAVVTRLSPETAEDDISDLVDLHFNELGSKDVYLKASELSHRLQHHLFDTLYHAVALTVGDAILLTADRKYFEKARPWGSIQLLRDWNTS